jgi:hypothetical protein
MKKADATPAKASPQAVNRTERREWVLALMKRPSRRVSDRPRHRERRRFPWVKPFLLPVPPRRGERNPTTSSEGKAKR